MSPPRTRPAGNASRRRRARDSDVQAPAPDQAAQTQHGSLIGARIPKLDASLKVSGQALYGHDVRLPGMLHGKILYSAQPHARVRTVDTSRAARLPGVKCVLTAADNPGTRFGYGKDNTPFKGELVRSLRDEVAGVVAIDEDVAEEALELIQVDYDPLPPMLKVITGEQITAVTDSALRLIKVVPNPFVVFSMTASRSKASSPPPPPRTRKQIDARFPLPTLPRSWWSWERPKRSASTMSIIEAFGTSIPTSMTVVETRMSISPRLKRCIVSSFSSDFIRPCIMATRRLGKRCCVCSKPCVSGLRFSFSDSSMIG